MRQLRFNHLLLLWLILLSCKAQATTSFADYKARVEQAAKLAQTLTASEQPTTDQLARLQRLKQLLPAQEEVEWQGQLIRADNGWLQEALLAIAQAPSSPQPIAALQTSLNTLQQRLAATAGKSLDEPQRARLTQILARSEYQQDQKQESAIKQWLKKVWSNLRDFLQRLLGSRGPQAQPSQYTLNLVRLVLTSVLLVMFPWVLFKLFQRFRARSQTVTGPATREILGEQISEETTTEDLLASARVLAQQGDYRGAVRRAYIALLFELEQHGKLRLHRSKTNRDYLEDLRGEQIIYPAFVALTRIFERIWYGHASATEFDFEGFLTGFREAMKSD